MSDQCVALWQSAEMLGRAQTLSPWSEAGCRSPPSEILACFAAASDGPEARARESHVTKTLGADALGLEWEEEASPFVEPNRRIGLHRTKGRASKS